MPKYNVIFVGAGPVGLLSAIQFKLRHKDAQILMLEKHREYQRKHVLIVEPSSFAGSVQDPEFQQMIKSFERKIPTIKLENALLAFAKKLGIEIQYETIEDCAALTARFPDCPLFIGADGSHSIVRQQIFENDLSVSETLSYIAEVKYQVQGETTEVNLYRDGLPVMTYCDYLVTEHVGKPVEGVTQVSVRFIIDETTYTAIKEATFKNPFKLDDSRIPQNLQRSMDAWLLARESMVGEKRLENTLKVTTTHLPVYASRNVRSIDDDNDQQWLLVGDAALGVPYFRSLNNGILCSSQLAIALADHFSGNHHRNNHAKTPEKSPLERYQHYVAKLMRDEIASAKWKNTGVNVAAAAMSVSRVAPVKRWKLKTTQAGREFSDTLQLRSVEREMQRREQQRTLPANAAVQSSSSSSSSSSAATMKYVTAVGDSTFDNGAWVGTRYWLLAQHFAKDGVLGSAFLGLIVRTLANVTLEHNENPADDKQWSIEKHLRNALPHNYQLIDRTVDGFTTTDVLNGAYQNKVGLPFFKKVYFRPFDEEGQKALRASEAIIVSVGGNNVREFILETNEYEEGQEREDFIANEYPNVIANLQREYVEILKRVNQINPNARIVIMTQYYPGVATLAAFDFIYPFMKLLGKVLHRNDPTFPTEPEQVIQRVVADTYRSGLKFVRENKMKIAVADITSSLNPTLAGFHVNQIEPSHTGGERIAYMLSELITGKASEVEGHIHQCNFLEGRKAHWHKTPLSSLSAWEPRTISSFRWGGWFSWYNDPKPSANTQGVGVQELDGVDEMKPASM